MNKISPEEEGKRKKVIFESMSPRRQKHILKKGYENWDPFQEPKDPIDIRKDKTKRTTHNAYGRGVFDICLGLINNDDRYKGMYEFSVWYRELLKREGHE